MEKDLLQTVIQVESDIRNTVESEQEKAAAWLESVRIALRQEFEAEKKRLDEEYVQALETERQEFEAKAQQEFEAAEQLADTLQNLPDETLHRVVKEFLPEILPSTDGEKNRDRQDVKS